MATTLVITNDFPPKVGGIESFIATACQLLDHDVVVLTGAHVGGAQSDARMPFEVVRSGSSVLLPTRVTFQLAERLLRRTGATRVLFGAAAPLALLAGGLRRAGAKRLVGLSHGHETWWATLPGTRQVLRRMADDLDHLGVISRYAAGRIAPHLSPAARARIRHIPPPVDLSVFTPPRRAPTNLQRPSTEPMRCVAAGRLVKQKGFDHLLRSWRLVLDDWPAGQPEPALLIAGEGPQRSTLSRLISDLGLSPSVVMPGSLSRRELVFELQRATVFALPMRTRFGGLNPEGLGLAALEAAACGLPVIVGASGGAPETVVNHKTGFVVSPTDRTGLARHLRALLTNPELSARMGLEGRAYVGAIAGAERVRSTLRAALHLA